MCKNSFKHFLKVLFFLFAFNSLSFFQKVKASEVIFQDDFSGDLSKWEKANPVDTSIWSIVDGMATPTFIQDDIMTQLVPKDMYWDDTVEQIVIDFDIKFGGPDQNFLIRYKGLSDFYELHFNGDTNLERTVPSFISQLAGYTPASGVLHHIKIEYLLSQIKLFVDGELKFAASDSENPYTSGKIGLRVGPGNFIAYDNIVVTSVSSPTPSPVPTPTPSPSPTPTPSPSTFPYFSQQDPEWNNASTIYDTANLWSSSNPSIGRWGCALTDAAMILKYHGITQLPNGLGTTPGNLNAWLKTQPDGYVGNGIVNWKAISVVSKIMHTTNPLWPKLEFKWGGNSISELQTELTSGRPAILQVPNHFITATKFNSPSDIDIADPFYPNTKLAEYGGTFLSMRKFTPSFTNLGFITVISDQSTTATLEKKSGNTYKPATGTDIYSESLFGAPDLTQSGSPLKVLDLAKPVPGLYRVRLSRHPAGVSTYKILMYGQDGEQSSIGSDLLLGTDPYTIDLSYQATGSSQLTRRIGFDELEHDLKTAKKANLLKKRYDAHDLLILLNSSEQLYRKNRIASKFFFDLYYGLFKSRKPYVDTSAFLIIDADSKTARSQLF